MGNADTSPAMKFHGVAGDFCIHSSYFTEFLPFFKTHRSCFPDLLNHPVTHICACAIRSFSFLLSQDRQEVIRAALVTEMHPAAGMLLETLR